VFPALNFAAASDMCKYISLYMCIIFRKQRNFSFLYSCLFFFLLSSGMSELVKERPANPIEYLASYLLKHDPQRVTAQNPPGPR
jgi:Dpy-30 motif